MLQIFWITITVEQGAAIVKKYFLRLANFCYYVCGRYIENRFLAITQLIARQQDRYRRFRTLFLPRDAMQARPMPSCGVCLCVCVCVCVCLSVTFVHSVKTNKDIFEIFPPPGSQAILVFLYQTAWQYSDENPPP